MHASSNRCWHVTGCTFALPNEYKAAMPEASTPRQPRESDSYVCALRLPAPATEVSQQCGACEEMCNHNMSWSAVECCVLVCRLTCARAIMFFGVVARQALSCRGVSYCVTTSVPDTRHKLPLRPALFLYIANSSRLLCFQPLADTQTSPSRIVTS